MSSDSGRWANVVVCDPLRTPIGRYGGALRDVPAADLAATVVRAVVERSGLGPDDVDEVLLGQCYPNGDAPAIGRVAALDAGLAVSTTGLQIDRRCGSGLQAVIQAIGEVADGVVEVAIAGGVESMSGAEHYTTSMRWADDAGEPVLHDRLQRARVTAGGCRHVVAGGMLETAENLRREHGISRAEQDEMAYRSHQRAVAAQGDGRFGEEIVPVEMPGTDGPVLVELDEHPRPDTSMESLAALRPVLARSDPEATVTAGNASGQNDGAAACLVTTRRRAESLGLRPFVRLLGWAVAGVPPATMGIGPVPATGRALGMAHLTLADIDLVEINEAFASQVIACLRMLGLEADDDRVNVNGSGISLGHPVGATGGRILATLAREMHRREARYGLETMCIGGGQGLAAVFERVA